MKSFSLQWNLDSLYSGGSTSSSLKASLDHLKNEIQVFNKKFQQLSDIKQGILFFQELEAKCQDLQYFIHCLFSQNVEDEQAILLNSQMAEIKANCDFLGEEISALLSELEEEAFQSLLRDKDLAPISFHLIERRKLAKEKLPIEQEKLACKLAIDGYQGWNEIYERFIGSLKISSPFSNEEALSFGQAENKLSHPDRNIRQNWFKRLNEVWEAHEEIASQIINHLAGFRLNLYQARKWNSILQEPLFYNRMEEKTLYAMWNTVAEHQGILQDYFHYKAQLLGINKLAWFDLEAPLPFDSKKTISFDEAAHFILKHLAAFSPSMGTFAERAFEERWIEAENRKGKRPGGFCAPFLRPKESRIFMTYSGTMTNLFTLAHELGHAYHSYELRNLPIFSQQYRMNVAETASTLAEMIVIDSMIEQAQEPKIRLSLLDHKLQRAVTFLMNIRARFLFELEFYQKRKREFVLAKELNALMEQAQRNAFGNVLSDWHPHFWIAKQHFFFTEVPFYNFPYTFGYLFSQGIYAHLKPLENREAIYSSLLQDTGRLKTEELALTHLGVKLEEAEFWENALQLIKKDVVSYVKEAKNLIK